METFADPPQWGENALLYYGAVDQQTLQNHQEYTSDNWRFNQQAAWADWGDNQNARTPGSGCGGSPSDSVHRHQPHEITQDQDDGGATRNTFTDYRVPLGQGYGRKAGYRQRPCGGRLPPAPRLCWAGGVPRAPRNVGVGAPGGVLRNAGRITPPRSGAVLLGHPVSRPRKDRRRGVLPKTAASHVAKAAASVM